MTGRWHRLRCRLSLHSMERTECYGDYYGPPEPCLCCRWCGGEYLAPINPLTWRIYDWFFGTRLGEWLVDREYRKHDHEQ